MSDGNKAIEIDPEYSPAWNNRGNAKEGLKDYDGALEDYSMAIEIDPEYAIAWNNRGITKANLEDYDSAWEDFSKAIELDPEYSPAWKNRGRTKKIKGDFQGAEEDYSKAIELNPEDAVAWHNRGSIKDLKEDLRGALEDYSKAIKLDPHYVDAWSGRGVVKQNMGDYKGAQEDYSKAIDLDPKYVDAWRNRGGTKESLGDQQGALEDYSKAIEIDPQDIYSWNNRSWLKRVNGDHQGALEDIQHVLQIDESNLFALFERAQSYKAIGKYELSIASKIKYYSLGGFPSFSFTDPQDQDIYDTARKHFLDLISPELKSNDENLVDYWECFLFWGEDKSQILNQGKQYYGHHGYYGVGYMCLTDKYLRVISIGELSRKYGKSLGLSFGKKLLLLFLRNFDHRSVEKKDKSWVIPFRDIGSVVMEDGGFQLSTTKENWEFSPYFGDDEYVQAILELARTGNLRRTIDMDKIRIRSKQSGSSDKIFDDIERLGSLKEKGLISEKEFEEKKKDLLSRL